MPGSASAASTTDPAAALKAATPTTLWLGRRLMSPISHRSCGGERSGGGSPPQATNTLPKQILFTMIMSARTSIKTSGGESPPRAAAGIPRQCHAMFGRRIMNSIAAGGRGFISGSATAVADRRCCCPGRTERRHGRPTPAACGAGRAAPARQRLLTGYCGRLGETRRDSERPPRAPYGPGTGPTG